MHADVTITINPTLCSISALRKKMYIYLKMGCMYRYFEFLSNYTSWCKENVHIKRNDYVFLASESYPAFSFQKYTYILASRRVGNEPKRWVLCWLAPYGPVQLIILPMTKDQKLWRIVGSGSKLKKEENLIYLHKYIFLTLITSRANSFTKNQYIYDFPWTLAFTRKINTISEL